MLEVGDPRQMAPSVPALARHAAGHHGLFRAADASALGFAPHHLRELVDRGWCERLVRGVYRVGGAPPTPQQRLLAEVWSHPDGTVAAFRAAGRVWALPGLARAQPEVAVVHGRNRHRGGPRVHGTSLLPPAHVTVRDAVPITTVPRTLFDLGGVLSPGRMERLVDDALQRRLVTLARLRAVFFVLAGRGRPGTATMRRILDDRDDEHVAPASELERVARLLLRDCGLPMPTFEVDLGGEEWIGRVDCLWLAERLVLELDGRRFHGGASARDADRDRENRLVAHGWRVIRLTWHDLVHRPGWCVELLRTALGGRGS
jgi:hypothetical protein